ncbi:hypothetical protein QTI66_00015 [Variovorax sp. J22R133]|uniref:hypothetical protein n=1 Tax=Variovorax brevis TaxID=3053503 RepID=UPI002578256F|nr:hypothetical protein [Variovorax sp. J22R133]MDM0110516.1 hypothetical protein [Variovorax sp. J22R133]
MGKKKARVVTRLARIRLLVLCLAAACVAFRVSGASAPASMESFACVLPAGPYHLIRKLGPRLDGVLMRDLPSGVLIGTQDGVYRFDAASRRVVPTDVADPVFAMHDLPGGGVLIGSRRGLFRFDAASREVVPVGKAETGYVVNMRDLPGGVVLIGAERGLFRFDAASREVVPAGKADTGAVYDIHDLPGGGTLIHAERGWFRFDAASREAVPAGKAETGPVFFLPIPGGRMLNGYVSAIRDLPGGGALIYAERGWFRFDAASREVVPVGKADMGKVFIMRSLPGVGALIGAERGWFRFDAASLEMMPAGKAETGAVYDIRDLPGGGMLIRTERGWFRFDAVSLELVPAGKADTGVVMVMRDLPGGGVLVGAKGLFRFDTASRELVKVEPAGQADTDVVTDIRLLPGGGVLVGTYEGLFRFDTGSRELVKVGPAGKAETGLVSGMRDLPGGGVLVGASKGLFRYDAVSRELVPAGKAQTVTGMYDLPGGGMLIRGDGEWSRFDAVSLELVPAGRLANSGIVEKIHALPGGGALIIAGPGLPYEIPAVPIHNAGVKPLAKFGEWVPQSDPREVRLRFRHPCAPVADEIGLSLVVSRRGDGNDATQSARIRRADGPMSGPDVVELAAAATFDKPGEWTLELRQAGILVGQPVSFTLAGPTIFDRLVAAWQWILACLVIAYIVLFAALMWISHRSLATLRMLMDPAWGAKLLTWPFFLLRHAPAVQRWVFEPWFQNVRQSMADRRPVFLDPPAKGVEGQAVAASALLGELSSGRRVWLQGRTGMGKSTVFAAWERAYYDDPDHATLADAARKHGFILVMLPVRHYAAIDPPDPKSPESWVVEAVRRRFEQFGVVVEDAGTLKAMLRAGHIALALDGTNEADRNDAIAAFARQYAHVKLIATSQSAAGEGWALWRLPADIGEQRAALLRLWLGDEAGSVLERRLASEPSVAITSGYDLRLVADLARNDPAGTPMPDGRIGLYRAVLDKATRGDGEPLDLLPLRRLAAKLIVEGRREFSLDAGQALGEGVAATLSSDGVRVIRRVGGSWEFRHDQMRAFLAASSLADDTPTLTQLVARIDEDKMFRLRRDDQEALWSFLADLLADHNVKELWIFAQKDPGERGLLQGALQRSADRRKILLVRPAEVDAPGDTSG